MEAPISTKVILDSRIPRKDQKYPVKLRVTFLRKQRYYTIRGYSFSEQEWARIMALDSGKTRQTPELKELRLIFNAVEQKAQDYIQDLDVFTWERFEGFFKKKTLDRYDLRLSFEDYIEELKSQGRISTAMAYQTALKSFMDFRSSVKFQEITVEFLYRYERWMKDKNASYTTIGMYVRTLRIIYNRAITEGLVKREQYPFGKNKFVIPAGKNVKKALTKEDLEKIKAYTPTPRSMAERARDFFLFSYYASGMNMADILELKVKDIQNEFLVFYRQKTIRTTRGDSKPIKNFILPHMKEVMKKWGNINQDNDSYIFPYYSKEMTAQRQYDVKKQFIRYINKGLKNLSEEIKISQISTYTARHTYATTALTNGIPLELLSKQMGHESTATTENYINTLDWDSIKQYSKML